MRTITCFGDRTSDAFLIIASVSQTKITRSHKLCECGCFQQCYIFLCTFLLEIETLERRTNMNLSQPLPPIAAVLGDSTCAVLPKDIYGAKIPFP